MRTIGIGLAVAALSMGQARFPMKYRASVGALGSEFDNRRSVDLGSVRVFAEEGDLRIEGKDHSGKPWRVWVPQRGGIGGTDVWTADFDHDGQEDLLIRSFFPSNGRCLDGGEITVVLFDEYGRPVPWNVTAQLIDDPVLPPILDLNRDDRAEFVITSCEYSNRKTSCANGEDRRIYGRLRSAARPYSCAILTSRLICASPRPAAIPPS